MRKKNYHVVKAENYWAVKKDGGAVLSAHNTQKQAIASGKLLAKLTHGKLSVHRGRQSR